MQTQDVSFVEAGVGVAEIDEAAEEEARADHEDERERYLGDDQRLCKPILAVGVIRSARSLERVSELKACRAQGWNDAEDQGCGDGDAEVEEQQMAVDGEIDRDGCCTVGRHTQEEPAGDGRDCNSQRAAGEGEQEALGEQLTDDALAACAESLANGEFASAGGGAGQQQIGDVGAGDEQNQRRRPP